MPKVWATTVRSSETNWDPLSKMVSTDMLKRETQLSTKALATVAVSTLVIGIASRHCENLSTMVRRYVHPRDEGNRVTRSMLTEWKQESSLKQSGCGDEFWPVGKLDPGGNIGPSGTRHHPGTHCHSGTHHHPGTSCLPGMCQPPGIHCCPDMHHHPGTHHCPGIHHRPGTCCHPGTRCHPGTCCHPGTHYCPGMRCHPGTHHPVFFFVGVLAEPDVAAAGEGGGSHRQGVHGRRGARRRGGNRSISGSRLSSIMSCCLKDRWAVASESESAVAKISDFWVVCVNSILVAGIVFLIHILTGFPGTRGRILRGHASRWGWHWAGAVDTEPAGSRVGCCSSFHGHHCSGCDIICIFDPTKQRKNAFPSNITRWEKTESGKRKEFRASSSGLTQPLSKLLQDNA